MKIGPTIMLLTIITLTSVGQDKILTHDSDTVFVFDWYNEILSHVGLKAIDKVESAYCFRIWDGLSTIEIKQQDSKLVGAVTYMVQQYKDKKEGRIYYRTYLLSDKTTEGIYRLINKYKLTELPTHRKISNWESGFDGITYITEFCDSRSYAFKTYWTPTYYKDEILEAREFLAFLSELNSIDELNLLGKKFWERQPFSRYYNFIGSATIVLNSN